MTKKSLHNSFKRVVLFYLTIVVLAIVIRICSNSLIYETFKDLIPLFIATPAIWLGYCLQRRSSYLQQLRSIWFQLVDAVQDCMFYTKIDNPTHQQHLEVLKKMSASIDGVRCVFENLPNRNGEQSLYPFEPLKNIYMIIENIGVSTLSEGERSNKHNQLFKLWRDVREEFLKEFDRDLPTFSHSHWIDPSKVTVYDKNRIEKTPS